MEATHIIKPEGFTEVKLVDLMEGYKSELWVIQTKPYSMSVSSVGGRTQDSSIDTWNKLWSKAPRGFV